MDVARAVSRVTEVVDKTEVAPLPLDGARYCAVALPLALRVIGRAVALGAGSQDNVARDLHHTENAVGARDYVPWYGSIG